MLSMHGICKRFGATLALRDVSLAVQPGEVVALIGENGAGKSTLMKVLSGAVAPDAGVMTLDGAPYRPRGPADALARGVSMIYQELNLAADLSVEDNIMLGQEERSRAGLLRRPTQRARVREALDQLGHPELQPHRLLRGLSMGARQLVEIARALVLKARVIVFDEPTSSLTLQDSERLFKVIDHLKRSGLAIVYISHFMEEIRRVCDRYGVLRDGASVGEGDLADVTESEIVALMVGRPVDDLFAKVDRPPPGEVLLRIDGLRSRALPKGVDLEVRRGEILGVAGLIGAGRTELLRAIYGLDAVRAGDIRIAGKLAMASVGRRIEAGMGMVSEDRKTEGLAQDLSLVDNLTLSRLRPYQHRGWLRLSLRREAAEHWLRVLGVKAASVEQPASALSGGNQQKLALARVMHQQADLLLLDEPTRGIDVAAKADIYRMMGKLAAEGKAIIFVSSYLPELMAVCDRVAVMTRNELKDVRPASQWTHEDIMALAVGVGSATASAP